MKYSIWWKYCEYVCICRFISVTQSCPLPHGLQHARIPCPSPTLQACSSSCPLSWWCNPVFPSIRVFSNESVPYIRGPKYWRFSFTISLFNGYSGLISFRIVWFNLLEDQETLKSLLQHHNSKASILQHSTFLMIQPSHPHMTTGKTIALTRCIFVSKVMSLLSYSV